MNKRKRIAIFLFGLLLSCLLTPNQQKEGLNSTTDRKDLTKSLPVPPKSANWDPQITLMTTAYPNWLCVADIDNDGYNDILTLSEYQPYSEWIRWNPNTNTWEPHMDGWGDQPTRAVVGDANNDGWNDLLYANFEYPQIELVLSEGPEFPYDLHHLDLPGISKGIAVADVNNDSYQDVVSVDFYNGSLIIFLWDSNTQDWENPIQVPISTDFFPSTGWDVSGIVINDIDDDGDNDILLQVTDEHDACFGIYAFLWNGDDWNDYMGWDSAINELISFAVGDVDNDGDNDLATIYSGGNEITIHTWPTGSFSKPIARVDEWPDVELGLVSIGDVNHDGWNDVVTANCGENSISILLWNETIGDLNPYFTIPVGRNPCRVIIGDANNDGYDDILTTNTDDDTVSIILWNEPPHITIKSPAENTLCGPEAPEFEIEIDDPHITEMWYTVDGGNTTQIFSANESINPLLWNTQGNGTVTIEFYARDIGNNTGSAAVTVRKDIYSPIITIIEPRAGESYIQSPFFNLSIDQADIEHIWYTLNENSGNNSFSEYTGIIDKELWNSTPYGPVQIKFSARDMLGNVGSKEIQLMKIDLTPHHMILDIINLTLLPDELNITFYIYNEDLQALSNVSVNVLWNGEKVSSNLVNLGEGYYRLVVSPIMIPIDGNPIHLTLNVTAENYDPLTRQIFIAADLIQDTEIPPRRSIPGFINLYFWFLPGIIIILTELKKKSIMKSINNS